MQLGRYLISLTAFAVAACGIDGAPPDGGRTEVSFTPQHGYQIQYISSDNGKSWLWYPGNSRSVQGRRFETSDEICYIHPRNSRNPVTGRTGGSKECEPKFLASYLTLEIVPGDVFNLTSGLVPYVRQKCDPTDRFRTVQVDKDLFRLGCGRQN